MRQLYLLSFLQNGKAANKVTGCFLSGNYGSNAKTASADSLYIVVI